MTYIARLRTATPIYVPTRTQYIHQQANPVATIPPWRARKIDKLKLYMEGCAVWGITSRPTDNNRVKAAVGEVCDPLPIYISSGVYGVVRSGVHSGHIESTPRECLVNHY